MLQDINTAEGIDGILGEIQEIKKLQKSQIVSFRRYKDSDTRIHQTYGLQGEILDRLKRIQLENERRQFLKRTLYRYALGDTGYDRQGC